MGLKNLAEGIIVQSMEDLWDESLREECIAFFRSEEFRLCAELAEMGLAEQVRILDMVKEVLDWRKTKGMKAFGNCNRGRKQAYHKWGTKELASCR